MGNGRSGHFYSAAILAAAMFFARADASPASPVDLCDVRPDVAKQRLDFFPQKRDLIAQNALMAVFSAVAYEPDGLGKYKLPGGWSRVRSESNATGLFAAIFENQEAKHVVVSFRGTEAGSAKDWLQDFLPFVKPQTPSALKLVMRERAQHQDWKVSVTGHSLGGGLALEASYRVRGVTAVVFNPSPRVGYLRGPRNNRVMFREKHDPLAIIRGNPSARKDWGLQYEVLLDFTPGFFGINLIKQHAIDVMAMNMLALAAGWSPDIADLHKLVCTVAPGSDKDLASRN